MIIYSSFIEVKNEAFDLPHVDLEYMTRRSVELLVKELPLEKLHELFDFSVTTTKHDVLVQANTKL